jgi:hypothetical protein
MAAHVCWSEGRTFELGGLVLVVGGEGRCCLYVCVRDHSNGGAINWVWRRVDGRSGVGSLSAVPAYAPEDECDGEQGY